MMMTMAPDLRPVLLADDDPDDRALTNDAFQQADLRHHLRCVNDGETLLAYLDDCRRSADPGCMPALILLDLNMPRLDGREALQAIKNDPDLRAIPVVVWTTSYSKEDQRSAIAAGCDEYVTKPPSFTEMVATIRRIGERWLPGASEAQA